MRRARYDFDEEALKPYLKFFKTMARGEGIDLELMMLSAGGTRYGTISKTAFQSQLTSYFKRFTFSDQLLFSLCHAYGTGAEDIFNGGYELVAWRDFVEDIEKAYPDKDNVWEESQMGRGDQWIPRRRVDGRRQALSGPYVTRREGGGRAPWMPGRDPTGAT